MSQNGKGSKRRPRSKYVTEKELEDNWKLTFSRPVVRSRVTDDDFRRDTGNFWLLLRETAEILNAPPEPIPGIHSPDKG